MSLNIEHLPPQWMDILKLFYVTVVYSLYVGPVPYTLWNIFLTEKKAIRHPQNWSFETNIIVLLTAI